MVCITDRSSEEKGGRQRWRKCWVTLDEAQRKTKEEIYGCPERGQEVRAEGGGRDDLFWGLLRRKRLTVEDAVSIVYL